MNTTITAGVQFSAATIRKAERLAESGGINADPQQRVVFWATGSEGDRCYRVQFGYDLTRNAVTWATCMCPNGRKLGGTPTCYHVAAALLTFAARLDAVTQGAEEDDDEPATCAWCGEDVTDETGSDECVGAKFAGRIHPECHYESECRCRA